MVLPKIKRKPLLNHKGPNVPKEAENAANHTIAAKMRKLINKNIKKISKIIT